MFSKAAQGTRSLPPALPLTHKTADRETYLRPDFHSPTDMRHCCPFLQLMVVLLQRSCHVGGRE
jgi:hypothetical protein